MFTKLLTPEERESFLELIYKIAHCDDSFSSEEDELIRNYKVELELAEVKDTASVEELMDYFGAKSEAIKKVVFFELYGMVMSDGKIAAEETSIMEQLKQKFGLAPDTYAKIISAASQLQEAYDAVYEALF